MHHIDVTYIIAWNRTKPTGIPAKSVDREAKFSVCSQRTIRGPMTASSAVTIAEEPPALLQGREALRVARARVRAAQTAFNARRRRLWRCHNR
jgi:hypothetical protein